MENSFYNLNKLIRIDVRDKAVDKKYMFFPEGKKL